jgi:hypothetical protein
MLKCNEITRERKFQILMKTYKLLASSQSPLESEYSIIDNISLSYNLVEYYISLLQKKNNKMCF